MFNTWERCEYSAITLLERGCVAEKKGNGKYANQQQKNNKKNQSENLGLHSFSIFLVLKRTVKIVFYSCHVRYT